MRLFLLLLLLPTPALAAEPDLATGFLAPSKLFALLFLMLGPKKVLAAFVAMTQGKDATSRRTLANRTLLFSIAAVLFAGTLGTSILDKYNVPISVLALAGGILLFLVALNEILKQFKHDGLDDSTAKYEARATRLAFPTIVTPWGIAAIIVFCELAKHDTVLLLTIAGITLSILLIDWIAMLSAALIIRWLQPALEVFMVVYAVVQVAVGLQLIFRSLNAMGFAIPEG